MCELRLAGMDWSIGPEFHQNCFAPFIFGHIRDERQRGTFKILLIGSIGNGDGIRYEV